MPPVVFRVYRPVLAIVVADTVPPDRFVAVVAVLALPLKAAVIVPALKLPEPSRATMADAVLAFVAVVAEFGMLVEAVMALVPLPNT